MKLKYFFPSLLLLISCSRKTNNLPITQSLLTQKYYELDNGHSKEWYLKDIEIDTIPGISLSRLYDTILSSKKPKEKIIVAILDGDIDIYHKDLKNMIWRNRNEIENNGLDDDSNGYVDDIHGWNFLGNKEGYKSKYVNFEITRILKELIPHFSSKDTTKLNSEEEQLFSYLKNIELNYNKKKEYFKSKKDNYDLLYNLYFNAKNKINNYVADGHLSLKVLDSLEAMQLNDISDSDFLILKDCIKNDISENYVIDKKDHYDKIFNRTLSLNFDDRITQLDDPNDLSDRDYGNNIINGSLFFMDHGTKMAGIISAIIQNNEAEIMSLPISAYGDEHDKDIALAIRYAVDNGAKIINMSFSKEYSLRKEWVFEAFKYAEKNDVLIIGIAGNSGYDLEKINYIYPNDNVDNSDEVSDNFLMLGASSAKLTSELYYSSSSFGYTDVDLFAPGKGIYVILPKSNDVELVSGTSLSAAITSGVASLVRSYYPNLTASQVKHILMDSGVEYTFDVKVGDTLVPFNTLSKSGKILNAYNAMIMADSISRAN